MNKRRFHAYVKAAFFVTIKPRGKTRGFVSCLKQISDICSREYLRRCLAHRHIYRYEAGDQIEYDEYRQ